MQFLKSIFTRNLGWKLLSLSLAFVLWIVVAREPELATSVSIPIEFKNLPEDLDISSSVPDRIHVEIRGPSGRLSRDYLADMALVLDLHDAGPGERTFTIRDSGPAAIVKLPVGVAFYRAVPSQLTLRFDRLLTRDIPVAPRYATSPPDGYSVSTLSISPAKLRLRGPEDHIQRIKEVLTDPIDLSGVVGQMDFQVHVNIGDPQVRLETPGGVTVHVNVTRRAPE
ncbi:MAG TPA: CdaR family protein [Bryobacteraceae bacterium]|nr:CdaR family protein [Bryobacteraceae bacterium]